MNNLHSSHQKDEKEKEMEKIKYKRGIIVEEDGTEREEIKIDESRMGKVSFEDFVFKFGDETIYIDKRDGGPFKGKAIYLSDIFDWVLCKDAKMSICLVPLKRESR